MADLLKEPKKEQIKKFVEVFEKLSQFEAEHRSLRNWGVFNNPDELHEICKITIPVLKWLKEKVDER